MLDFIERNKVGILSTIVIHLLLITLFMVVQFGNLRKQKEKQQIFVDFVDLEELQKQVDQQKEEVKKLAQKELAKEIQSQTRNIAVNEAEKEANQNIDKMVNDIKSELNIKDRANASEVIAPKNEDKNDKKPNDAAKKPDFTINEKGERTFYKGATTISFFLEGRTHVYLPVPVYKCQGSGKVVMDIVVNTNGYVMSASINKAESKITEDCLVEAANRAALTARFNASGAAPNKQKGRISYTFIAQ